MATEREKEFKRNLALALAFIEDLLDHPEKLDGIPDGAMVMFDSEGAPLPTNWTPSE